MPRRLPADPDRYTAPGPRIATFIATCALGHPTGGRSSLTRVVSRCAAVARRGVGGPRAATSAHAPRRARRRPGADPAGRPSPSRGEQDRLKEAKDGSGDLVYEATRSPRASPDGTSVPDKRSAGLSRVPCCRDARRGPSVAAVVLKMLLQGQEAAPPPPGRDRLPPPETTRSSAGVALPGRSARGMAELLAGLPHALVSAFGRLTWPTRWNGSRAWTDPIRRRSSWRRRTDRRMAMAGDARGYVRRAPSSCPPGCSSFACDPAADARRRRAILVALGPARWTRATPEGRGGRGRRASSRSSAATRPARSAARRPRSCRNYFFGDGRATRS
jgi:hypothetical protein